MKINYKNINPLKFHDELIRGGIIPLFVENDCLKNEHIAENTWITFADGTDMALAQQIIDAHDPTPLPPQPTQEELLKQELAKTNAMILELTEFIIGGM